MGVNEIGNAPGAWDLKLRPGTPRDVWDRIDYFGRIVVMAGRLDPAQYGDNLLTEARYVGVVRQKDVNDGELSLSGPGMVVWLGDEDQKGPVIETTLSGTASTFADAVRDVLSVQANITEGTLFSVPGTASYSYQWKTVREALESLCDIFGTPTFPVEYRVNGDGSLDAGRVEDLYDTTPQVILTPKDSGYDGDLVALPSRFSAQQDVEDFTTRTVAFSQGEGEAITTEARDLDDISRTNPYLGLDGQPITVTRMIDASGSENANLGNLAAQQLGRFATPNNVLTLSTVEYDISGDVNAGDYVYAYDPDAGLVDESVEIYFRGQRINPVILRVLETTWPVVEGMTVAYRHNDGTWIDLTDYVEFESAGDTSLKVADFDRALTSSTTTPPGDRVNGDSSVPGVPVFGDFAGTTYQANGDETKAQIVVTWTEPLNTDGSTIVDGDHYEIRYRPNITAPYAATWTEASQDTWNELHTWNQPRVAPITNTDWQTVYAPWDSDSYRVQELTPSVIYEFQIRAVDFASPPNKSQWSATTAFAAPRDTMPPSTPAAPLVVGSLIAIQVMHLLGSSGGGTFNLEADTNHLEVHVSNNPTFLPDDTTIVGRLMCAAALQSGIPVVGTFPVEETDERYVKVVAVDRSGNKSNPSDASAATPGLIDDEHISSLTVSKVTAGTITSDWLLAAAIKTAESGQRVELSTTGLQAYGEEGDQTVNLSSDPEDSGNYITFTKAGTAVASIDEDGNMSGQNVSVNGDLTVQGDNVIDLINALPKGLLFLGQRDTTSDTSSGTEIAVLELGAMLVSGRMYRISTSTLRLTGTNVGDVAIIRVRDGLDASPSTGSDLILQSTAPILTTASGGNIIQASTIITCNDDIATSYTNYHSGEHRYLLTVLRLSGTGSVSLFNNATANGIQLMVEDLGPLIDNTGVDQSAGGGGTVPVQTYTKRYSATWSGSYDSSNQFITYWGNSANQGDAPPASYGNQRGLIGFNASQIQSDLAGATIKSIKVTLYANHWYYNAGGTARLGTHNYTSRPTTWTDSRVNQNRWTSTSWPKPGKRTITLPNSVGDEFKAGTSTGISTGPGSSSYTDYGRFAGAGSGSNTPVLEIVFTK